MHLRPYAEAILYETESFVQRRSVLHRVATAAVWIPVFLAYWAFWFGVGVAKRGARWAGC